MHLDGKVFLLVSFPRHVYDTVSVQSHPGLGCSAAYSGWGDHKGFSHDCLLGGGFCAMKMPGKLYPEPDWKSSLFHISLCTAGAALPVGVIFSL